MSVRSGDVRGGEPMRLSAAGRLLGYDRRTLLKHSDRLRIFRVGREYRVPPEAIADVLAGVLTLPPSRRRIDANPSSADRQVNPDESKESS